MNFNIISTIINNQLFRSIIIVILSVLHFLNLFFEKKYNKKTNNKNKNISIKFTDFNNVLLLSCLIILVLSFFFKIPLVKVIFQIIDSLYLAHIFIINPLFKNKLTFDYQKENTLMSALLFLEITYFLTNLKIENIFLILKEPLLVQSTVILIILTIIYLIVYMVLIDTSFIIYYLNKLYFNNIYIKNKKIINIIKEKYNFKNINEELNKDYKWSEILLFFILIIKIIIAIIMNFIICSPVIIINNFLKSLDEYYSKISENNIYSISKIALVTSIIFVYIIIEISGEFSTSLISIYELISTSILIPLILEKLIKNNKTT